MSVFCAFCVFWGENRESGSGSVFSVHSVCFGVKIVNPGLNLWFLCILRVLGENRESGSESVFSVHSACFG